MSKLSAAGTLVHYGQMSASGTSVHYEQTVSIGYTVHYDQTVSTCSVLTSLMSLLHVATTLMDVALIGYTGTL
jgi:hypothetical protein